jgi:hypothetical protein
MPLALAAASPCTNSTSPTGFISTGPFARYIARASMKTVLRTLCPFWMSALSSWSRYRAYGTRSWRRSQKWWCGSQIGRSGSSAGSSFQTVTPREHRHSPRGDYQRGTPHGTLPGSIR